MSKPLLPELSLAKTRAALKLLDAIAEIGRGSGSGDIVIPFVDATLVVSVVVKIVPRADETPAARH